MSTKFQRIRLGLVSVSAALALGISGCGTDSEPDLVNGKVLFNKTCASCHTLKRANTFGKSGPNLDEAFANARQSGFGESTIAGIVKKQILFPQAKMPADLLKGSDARDVGAYVGHVAAQPGEDTGALASVR